MHSANHGMIQPIHRNTTNQPVQHGVPAVQHSSNSGGRTGQQQHGGPFPCASAEPSVQSHVSTTPAYHGYQQHPNSYNREQQLMQFQPVHSPQVYPKIYFHYYLLTFLYGKT
jgi:hypothetical protein